MSICDLRIHDLRCFGNKTFHFTPHLNFVIAQNGAGKTSLLEALYLLSCGHSFRTREISPLIRHGQTEFTLFARLYNNDTLSIQKSLKNAPIIKINQSFCKRTSELAQYLPCQIYYQDIFSMIDGGPAQRRTMLDWGMFHVEQCYHQQLKSYYQILKQRNALLRQNKNRQWFKPWDCELDSLGESLHSLRKNYINSLQLKIEALLKELSNVECTLKYEKGWDKREQGISLYEQLQANFEKDVQKGYTTAGIHQADIHFLTEQNSAKKMFSRGQQKILLIAVKMAQTELITAPCLHLLDDIFAELDIEHIQRLLNKISKSQGQFIISTLPNSRDHIKMYKNENIISL